MFILLSTLSPPFLGMSLSQSKHPIEMHINLTNVVVAYVPVRAVPDVKPCPVLLHNHARHNVLEGLAQVVEFLHASIAYCVYPM